MRNHMLSTIGYEGASLADFIKTLEIAGIEIVFDIRDRAQSRRAGFSKSALSDALDKAGIEYAHLRELGDPKEGRDAARAGNIDLFIKTFTGVLRTPSAQAALETIVATSEAKSACLLCYERDHRNCHRKLVSDRIEAQTGVKTRHLGVRQFEQAA